MPGAQPPQTPSQDDSETEPGVSIAVPMVIACGMFMNQLDSTIIATSIPQIADSLGESPLRLNLAITSYLISLAVFIPISGWIADRFGARRVFCVAIALFTFASALCGLSTNLWMLVAMRVLQGLGGAMMTPVGRLILVRTFRKDQLLTAMSYASMPALVGPTIGPIVGGFLTTYISWRWIFYINIPIGTLGIVLALRYIRNFPMPAPPRFDFRGFALVGIGLVALELAIENLGRHVIAPEIDAGLFGAAAVLLALYVWHALPLPHPVLDLALFRIRSFRTSTVAGGLCRLAIGAVPFLLPLMLQLGFGLDPLHSGLLTFVTSIGAMMMKTIVRRVVRQFGFRNLLAWNGVLLGLWICGIAAFQPDIPHWQWLLLPYLLAYGFVRSVQFTTITALAYADLTVPIMSKATSMASVIQQLCNSFGVAIGATVLTLTVGSNAAITAKDFQPVFLIIGLFPIIATFGFLSLKHSDGAQLRGLGS
jgi:EmrB/QacA subfamily drug resistance transporter